MRPPVYAEALKRLDCMVAEAWARHAESKADLDHMFEWREWFGFRPGWPARRALRLAKRQGAA